MLSGESEDGTLAQEALDWSDVVEKALCYNTTAMFSPVHMLVENVQLYMLIHEKQHDCPELTKCQL